MKKLLILFLLVCSIASAQYGPIRFPSSGGGTFTGGTLTSNLTMGGDGTIIELASGSSVTNLAFRFKDDTDTGVYRYGANTMAFVGNSNARMIYYGNEPSVTLQISGPMYFNGLIDSTLAHAFYIAITTASSTKPTYAFKGDEDSGVGRQAVGKPTLTSDGVECIRVASSGTQIFQYTKLGDAAPALKCKLLTGTTAAAAGGSVTVNHGLTSTKIVSYTVVVNHGSNDGMNESFGAANATHYFNSQYTSTLFQVTLGGSATGITEKPFSILIWYTE